MVGSAELVANQNGAYDNLNEPQPSWNRRSHIIAITVSVQVLLPINSPTNPTKSPFHPRGKPRRPGKSNYILTFGFLVLAIGIDLCMRGGEIILACQALTIPVVG